MIRQETCNGYFYLEVVCNMGQAATSQRQATTRAMQCEVFIEVLRSKFINFSI